MSDSGEGVTPQGAEQAVALVERLHAAVEIMRAPVAASVADRLQCKRGCSGCCVDDLAVFTVEAERIRRAHPALLEEGTPGPVGGCAFLDETGSCRVYEVRPYVCRTQGLPLRWFEEDEDEEIEELRSICPLNEVEGEPLDALDEASCWLIGPVELKLQALQEMFDGGQTRVALRDLFG